MDLPRLPLPQLRPGRGLRRLEERVRRLSGFAGAGVTSPRATELGSFGGPTQTAALLPSSPMIHKGTRANYAGTNTPLLTDQRGLPLASPPDIGAFQTQNG